jgi:hypothetical protein
MTVERLNLVPFPHSDEQLPAYLCRVGYAGSLSLAELFRSAGLSPKRVTREELYGVSLRRPVLAALAGALGVEEWRLDRMTLMHMPGIRAAIHGCGIPVAAALGRSWLMHTRGYGCPDCLRETGGVRLLEWRSGLTIVCVRHHRLLLDACPECGGSLGPGSGKDTNIRGWVKPVEPLSCGHRAGRTGLCGVRLDRVSGAALSPPWAPALLRAQGWISRALRGRRLEVAGSLAEPEDVIADVQLMVRMLLALGVPRDVVVDPGYAEPLARYAASLKRAVALARLPSAPPPNVTAGLLPVAVDLVRGRGQFGAADELFEQARSRLVVPRDVHTTLAEIRTRCLSEAAARVLGRYSGRRALLLGLSGYRAHFFPVRYGYHVEHVPPCLSCSEFEPFRELTEGRWDTKVRLAVPAMAARFCARLTWREAVAALGTGELIKGNGCNQVLVCAERDGYAEAFLERVHLFCSDLERKPATDYREQRLRLAEMEPISQDEWEILVRNSSVDMRRRRPSTLRFAASAWIWAELTHSDQRLAPTWEQCHRKVQLADRRILGKHFVQGTLVNVLEEVRAVGRVIARVHGVAALGRLA